MTIDLATLALKADTTDLLKLDKALDLVQKRSRATEQSTSSLERTFKRAGVVIGGALSVAAITKFTTTAVNDFRAIEKGLIGVQKTTDFTGAEMVQFEKEVDSLSRRIPVATESLVQISGVAGQLGIKGVDNISKFTEVVGGLTIATDIVGEEGAANIARLINVTGESISTVDKFGTVLVALGNNSAATESEILSLATQVGQATSTFSVSSAEALAMGAAMRSVGVSAELGGSVVGRAMRSIEAAINEGGDAVKNLSAVTGIAAEDIKDQFGENATVVFQRWVEGIGKLIEGGMSAAEALEMFGIGGEEALKVLPTMAVNSEILAKSLNIANKELETGAALNNEVAKASESLDAQLAIGRNIVTDYSAEIGKNLAPSIKGIITDFRQWDESVGDTVKQDITGWIGSGIEAVYTFGKAITVADEIIGIAITEWLIGWENFTYSWERGTLALSSSFGRAFDQIKLIAADGLDNLAGNMATLPIIGDDIAKKFATASNNIKVTATASAEYEAELAKLTAAHEANVRALEFHKDKQAEVVAATFTAVEATKEEQKASTEKTETVVQNDQTEVESARESTQIKSELATELDRADQERIREKQRLEEELTDNLLRLTEDEFWYKTETLDKEVEKMYEVAGEDAALQDQIAQYHELKQDEILADYQKKQDDKFQKTWETDKLLKDTAKSVVDAVVAGENIKIGVAKVAQDYLKDYAVRSATEGVPKIIEGLGSQIGAWTGLGTSQALTDGETWQEKVASGVGFLAQAAAAVIAGKAIGDNFADGGWIGRHPGGGLIEDGSWMRDDVFLSRTGNVFNYGKGGEFVVNPEATAANRPLLELMNSKRRRVFADGGPIADPMEAAREMNNNGFEVFVNEVIDSGNWKKAIITSVAWYVASALGMIGGKELGKSLFADGGEIDLGSLRPGGTSKPQPLTSPSPTINKYIEDIQEIIEQAGSADPSGDWGIPIGRVPWGDLWDWIGDRGGRIGEIWTKMDMLLEPFFADVLDPEKSVSGVTFERMIQNAYETVVDEIEDIITDSIFDPFGIFHNGIERVPRSGPYLLQEGERVQSTAAVAAGNNDYSRIVELLNSILNLIEENSYILKKFDTDGLPPARTY